MAQRWVLITDDFPPRSGGVASWTERLATGLHSAGEEVVVFARARAGLGEGLPYPVRGVRGPSFGRHGGLWTAAAAWGAVRGADRVLASTWPVATRLVGGRGGARLDVVFHGSDLTRPPVDPAGLERVLRGGRHWAVSAYLQGILAARGATAGVLPAPVVVRRGAARRGPRPERWLYLGRATDLKGGERFVRLVAAAGVQGAVVGDGPALRAWRALAERLGARVRFEGAVARGLVDRWLDWADLVLLLPRAREDGSGAEGLGLALIEAAGAGVAGVGCAVGGVPEALGPAGLILADPDDAASSVEAIRAWWSPERGLAARDWAEGAHGTDRLVAALLGG
ncbi:MAG: glycosyltransferase family 4 protein [Deltaproteobacteria bacterium]|nr:glycosyltransferase family 4 protein [Deltaproteobacteria bacterium]